MMTYRPLRALLVVAAVAAAGCATAPAPDVAAPATPPAASADKAPTTTAGMVVDAFGVKLMGVRLSGNGYLVDVRYQVLDAAKAQPLLDRSVRPVLIDEATGNRFYVPTPPIVGSLRQTARNKVIHTDRTYFMLFANPDRRLQPGSNVTLYVGDQKFANLRVEAL